MTRDSGFKVTHEEHAANAQKIADLTIFTLILMVIYRADIMR
jgi:hypothetical protein